MPSVCRKDDTAGGALSASQTKVKANGKLIIVDGDSVASHGLSPHDSATISAGSGMKVKIGGVKVCNSGDLASCGHSASSDSNVKIGD